jgi:hypothetical protein
MDGNQKHSIETMYIFVGINYVTKWVKAKSPYNQHQEQSLPNLVIGSHILKSVHPSVTVDQHIQDFFFKGF